MLTRNLSITGFDYGCYSFMLGLLVSGFLRRI